MSRAERWFEAFSAALLALATMATAWCGYQAARWDGEQAVHLTEASTARIDSAQVSNRAVLTLNLHAGLFFEWAAAVSQENQDLADFLYQRFPRELKKAVDAWLATQPLQNPGAPPSPFAMAEYALPDTEEARRLDELAQAKFEQAIEENARSDQYVLLTVIFASVLFFGGISGKFRSPGLDLLMLALAVVVFVAGVGILLTLPVG